MPGANAPRAAACLFNGFSDRSRLAIVQHLLSGEHRVIDLVGHLGPAQSTVSKHLACLLDCGIVEVRARGRASVYFLDHHHLEATLALPAATEQMLALAGDAVTLCAAGRPGRERDAGMGVGRSQRRSRDRGGGRARGF